MAATKVKKEKEPTNIVHQSAIFCETVRKEQRHQKLYTNYGLNPYKKVHAVTGKPHSLHDSGDGKEDELFKLTYKRAQQVPQEKCEYPVTEAQEIGWYTAPLVDQQRNDPRLYHPKNHSEVTKFMDAYWRQKEQEKLQQ